MSVIEKANILQTLSPIDNSIYVEREYASQKKIEQTLNQAIHAQKKWTATSLDDRKKLCQSFVDAFMENKKKIAEQISWQMGRPILHAAFEVDGVKERAEYMIAVAEEALSDINVPNKAGFKRYMQRYPVGVVFVVAPWNYPYLTAINTIIPALLAGNSVILKHSSQTPLCAEQFSTAFKKAGMPDGVFQYLHLDHNNTQKIVHSTQIDYVAFTGSVAGGRAIQQSASARFIGIGLELGGKDPAYVRADADLEKAVGNLVEGAFFNSGQSCCGVERIYVDKKIFNSFIEGYVDLVQQYKLGNPLQTETTLGPVVRRRAADFVRAQTAEAISQGAKALIDPKRFIDDKIDSPYLAPQVLVNVDHSMRIMTEENFGPLVGIMSVDSDNQAIQYMNDSEYGLTASVWTQDLEAGIKIGEQVQTGTWFMNRCDYLDPALAWTGVKDSGRGISLSTLGYEQLTRVKSFHCQL